MKRTCFLLAALLFYMAHATVWAAQSVGTSDMQCPDSAIYPAEAMMYHLEGSTVLEFSLAADGAIVDIIVKRSSGWAMLDEAAVEALAGCRTTLAPDSRPTAKRLPIEFTWSFDGLPKRHVLVPNSCAASDRFDGFRAFDTSASGADGILVRTLIRSSGQPYFTRAERGSAPEDVAALAVEYLRTCRFALPAPGAESEKAIYGRVLLK
ncbi:MAG: energy transducer TonB [Telluria sp.]